MSGTETAGRVAQVRAFNRFYTQLIGALQEGLLETPYSLTEARVIFELAQQPRAEVTRLRRDLRLDAGYLSRILARFEADGLATRTRSQTDGRRQLIELTDAGRAVYESLNSRADDEIATMLAKLTAQEQDRLVRALATVREVLGDRPRGGDVVLRDVRPGDLGWVVQRNAVIYAEEYGWDQTYEALVAKIVAEFAEKRDPARERVWIAEVDGEPVGSVFCVRRDDETAQLRLLLVEPGARGMGVGTRLVEECLRFARDVGYKRMVLWTNSVLADAQRIYERFGFSLDEGAPHHSFGRDLIGQWWSIEL